MKADHVVVDCLLDGDDERLRRVEDVGHEAAVGGLTPQSSLQLELEQTTVPGEEPESVGM